VEFWVSELVAKHSVVAAVLGATVGPRQTCVLEDPETGITAWFVRFAILNKKQTSFAGYHHL
jgi:hypothetical protein